MNQTLWQIVKIVICAFLILILQIAVVKELCNFPINLPLIAIITIASFSSLEISLYSATLFVLAISLLSYNNNIYWLYLVVAFVTNQFNPKNLEDRFLVAAFYCVVFSPLLELAYNPIRENVLHNSITTTLINLTTLVPLYFILKMGIGPKKPKLYS